MNTARIVVLSVTIGAGGIAAYVASGSDGSASPSAARAAAGEDGQWQMRPPATASITLTTRHNATDALRLSDSVSIIGDLPSQMTAQA